MRIGIIGAGNVGRALAGAFSRTGHDVVVSATRPEHAESAASQSGAAAAGSNAEASRGADVVVLAVPYNSVGDVLSEIGDSIAGEVVVDVTNPLTSDYSGLQTYEKAGAELAQEQVPNARVVKAFNYAFATRLSDPRVDGVPLDGFVAGDDADAKRTVLRLVEDVGLRPLDAGPLSAARALEALAFLNITLNAAHGWPWQSGWKLIGPTG